MRASFSPVFAPESRAINFTFVCLFAMRHVPINNFLKFRHAHMYLLPICLRLNSAGFAGGNSCCQIKRANAGYVCRPAVYIVDEHQPLVPPSESCVRPQHFADRPVPFRGRNERHRRDWLFYDATSRSFYAVRGGPCARARVSIGSRGACSEPPSRHGMLILELHQAREEVCKSRRDVINMCRITWNIRRLERNR